MTLTKTARASTLSRPALSNAEKAEKLVAIRAVLADRMRQTRATERRQRAVARTAN